MSRLPILLCILCLSCTSLSGNTQPKPKTPPFRLKTVGSNLILKYGQNELLLKKHGNPVRMSGWANRKRIRMAGGWELQVPTVDYQREPGDSDTVVLTRSGREQDRLYLNDFRKKWLADDKWWGGHKKANEVRYADTHGGSYYLFLNCLVPQRNSVLGILNWQDAGTIGSPVHHQHLVRITFKPTLQMQVIRRLNVPYASYGNISQRLFPYQNHVLLYGNPHAQNSLRGKGVLYRITPEGRSQGVFVDLPTNYMPIDVWQGRYLVLHDSFSDEKPLVRILDFQSKRIIKLKNAETLYQENVNTIITESEKPLILDGDRGAGIYLSPHSKPIILPRLASVPYLWKRFLVTFNSRNEREVVTIWDTTTGKKIQTLPVSRS